MTGLGVRQTSQLKCINTNGHSMDNKQEELSATTWQANCDLVVITKTLLWDWFNNWNVAMDGYKHFRMKRQERRGGGMASYVRDCSDLLSL